MYMFLLMFFGIYSLFSKNEKYFFIWLPESSIHPNNSLIFTFLCPIALQFLNKKF